MGRIGWRRSDVSAGHHVQRRRGRLLDLAADITLWQRKTCFGMSGLGIWRGLRFSGLD